MIVANVRYASACILVHYMQGQWGLVPLCRIYTRTLTMHELSIAYELVTLAEASARAAHASRVLAVHLKLGVFAGVETDALRFGYESATRDTLLAGSRLLIEEAPLVIFCPGCAQEAQLASIQHLVCPRCGNPTADIRQGREVELRSIEIAEEDVPAADGDITGETAMESTTAEGEGL